MLGYQLAVANDGKLVAFLEPVSVRFDEGDLGAVDAFLFDAREEFVLRGFVLLNELIPRRDFLIQTSDVLEWIIGRNHAIEDAQKIVEDLRVPGGFGAEPAVGPADFAI